MEINQLSEAVGMYCGWWEKVVTFMLNVVCHVENEMYTFQNYWYFGEIQHQGSFVDIMYYMLMDKACSQTLEG